MKNFFVVLGIGIALLLSSWLGLFEKEIDYNADVKPILNKNCMACHGGVKKAGNVSFLFEEEMLKPGKSGKIPVVRGDANASEMIRRILSDDPDERMPKKGPELSDEEVNTLKKWIDQGAK
uniref:c-type cytochrome domain-containing protein n=1 Tax=Persicitalea sp. TaxID=3100273 RepID=UPI003593D73C